MHSKKTLAETLAQSHQYRNQERAYNEATGLLAVLQPVKAGRLPPQKKRIDNCFCVMMAKKSAGCAACLQMQGELLQNTMREPVRTTCAYGISKFVVPVKLGSQTIGLLQSGFVLRQTPTAASFRRAVERAKDSGVDLDENGARAAYLKTPVVPERKLDLAVNLLRKFADSLTSSQLSWNWD